jgi:hypothetical protein
MKIVPLRHFFPLNVVPLIKVLLYEGETEHARFKGCILYMGAKASLGVRESSTQRVNISCKYLLSSLWRLIFGIKQTQEVQSRVSPASSREEEAVPRSYKLYIERKDVSF